MTPIKNHKVLEHRTKDVQIILIVLNLDCLGNNEPLDIVIK